MIARVALCLATAAALAGCGRLIPSAGASPERDWKSTLRAARQAADSGRWAVADRRMTDFAAAHPAAPEAHETLYWRGLFRLAAGNDTAAAAQGVPTLQRYLARGTGAHRVEARVLLDLATTRATLQQEASRQEREITQIRTALGRAQDARTSTAGAERSREDRNLAEEVDRLRAELAKANQELERVRRRLAGQRP